jgi:ribonucleoside-diphosphate reductase alpha chain
MTAFLDAVMEEFILKLEALRDHEESEKRRAFSFMERAYNFAKANRALGLGVLGYHSLLQSKGLAFESQEASELNKEVFKLIKEKADSATKELGARLGEPEVLKGYGRRNTTLLAIAPTTSSAFILGQVSQGIEPIWSNCYVKDVAKMKVTIKNPSLEKLLEGKGKNNKETWDSIRDNDGSVQHLDFLSDDEKAVYRTFAEIDQTKVIEQAADRQKFIDQAQSLNIMVEPDTPVKEINQMYIQAWKQGVKSLYYQHSMNAAQQMVRKKLQENEAKSNQ